MNKFQSESFPGTYLDSLKGIEEYMDIADSYIGLALPDQRFDLPYRQLVKAQEFLKKGLDAVDTLIQAEEEKDSR